MNPLLKLILLALNLLILGAIIHWILGFFQNSFRAEVVKTREFLDKIFAPMLGIIQNYVPQIKLQDGRAVDLSHLILIVALALGKKLATFIF